MRCCRRGEFSQQHLKVDVEMRDFACLVSGDRGFGLPSLEKFSTRNLPSNVIHRSEAVKVNGYGEDCDSGSDMDLSPDSGSDIQSRHYSVVTSPQDDKISNRAASIHEIPFRNQSNYHCPEIGHFEFGLVAEPIRLKQEYSRGGVKSSGSATSTEVSSGQSNDNSSGGYSATSTSQANKEKMANQVFYILVHLFTGEGFRMIPEYKCKAVQFLIN